MLLPHLIQIIRSMFHLFPISAFISSKLEHWLQYQFDKNSKSVFFAIDAIVVAVTLAGLHLNLVPTFIAILHYFIQQLIVVFLSQSFV